MHSGTFSRLKIPLAQRVILLFLLAALVPVAAVGAYVYIYVPKVLDKQARTQLSDAARSYGQAIYNRLLMAEQALINAQRQQMPEVANYFQNIETISSSHPALEDSSARFPLLSQSPTQIVIDQTSSRFGMLIPTTSDGNAAMAVIGWLDQSFLWGTAGDQSSSINLCVVTKDNCPLNCPDLQQSLSEIPLHQFDGDMDLIRFDHHQKDQIAGRWKLPLAGRFVAEELMIFAFQSREAALAPLGLSYFFLLITLLALAVVVLVSLIQIRRLLQPMSDLLRATQRIADGDFKSSLKIRTGNEFESLSIAFNDMSARLGKQFEKLSSGAQMDRLILESGMDEPVLDQALRMIPDFVTCVGASVCILDADEIEQATIHVIDSDGNSLPSQQTQVLSKFHSQDADIEYTVLGEGPIVQYMLPLEKLGARYASTSMIRSNNETLGVLCLGFHDKPTKNIEAEIIALRDRLAVVLSAVERERHLFHQAHYDSLTGLANRNMQVKKLYRALAQAKKQHKKVAVLFIDLDRFKNVNDSLGHSEGDGVLAEVAHRFKSVLRQPDSCARLGGDEFVVLVNGISQSEQSAIVADRLLETLETPIELSSGPSYISASIGISVYPDDGQDAETLMKNADAAMYMAKENGRARKAFFSDQLNRSARNRLSIESALRAAIKNNEFDLFYQPLFSSMDRTIVEAEALIRWPRGPEEFRSPASFIPVAEELGLINDIGIWVAETAMDTQAMLQEMGHNIRIGINISPVQVREPSFTEKVIDAAQTRGINPASIELEMTEHSAFGSSEGIDTIASLNNQGFRIALDDFGTGYSSLSYLTQFPIKTLKLDRSFITDIQHDARKKALVKSVIDLAHNLGKESVGEGVETEAHARILGEMGCNYLQGFHLCKPVERHELIQMMEQSCVRKQALS